METASKDLYWNFCVALLVTTGTYAILWYANPIYSSDSSNTRNVWLNLGISILFGIFIYAILYHYFKNRIRKE